MTSLHAVRERITRSIAVQSKPSKRVACILARLALADMVSSVISVDDDLMHEVERPDEPWREDISIAKHIAAAIDALTTIAGHLGFDPIEVFPQRVCTLCGRLCVEWRRDGGEIICVLCRSDDDFDVRVRRVQRELAALSIEHGNAEQLGDRILSDLDLAPDACDARLPHLPDARCILPRGHKAKHYWPNHLDCKHPRFHMPPGRSGRRECCTSCGVAKAYVENPEAF